MSRVRWAAVAALLASCGTTVPATNPFDPNTPPSQQAAGKLTGLIDQSVLPGGGQAIKIGGTTGAG